MPQQRGVEQGVGHELLALTFRVAVSRGCCSWCIDEPLAPSSQAAVLHEHRSFTLALTRALTNQHLTQEPCSIHTKYSLRCPACC